jgi:ABC-2 type transport system permease protein
MAGMAPTQVQPTPGPSRPAPARIGVTTQFGRVVASEWTKIRSVRSTMWCLVATVVITIGLATLLAIAVASSWPHMKPDARAGFDPVGLSLAGGFIAQLIIGALGVLVITAEYSSGTIRATLIAVPQRVPVLVAKAVVFAITAFVVSVVSAFTAFWLCQAILHQQNIGASLSQPGVFRVVFGTALFLTGVGLMGLGIGAIVRHTAGAISVLVGILLVIPILTAFLPSSWKDHIQRYLPDEAGSALLQVNQDPSTLHPWPGFALFCGYVLLALVIGGVVLTRRDA